VRANFIHIEPLVRRVLENNVPGDLVEFGIWHGTTFMPMAELARVHRRTIHAVDSFRGMGPATDRDNGQFQAGTLDPGGSAAFRELAAPFGKTIQVHEGWVPGVLEPMDGVEALAFAHVDLDQYAPTLAVLRWLWPRMSPGGIVACHDWRPPSTQLASAAIDQWREEAGVPVRGSNAETGHCWFIKP